MRKKSFSRKHVCSFYIKKVAEVFFGILIKKLIISLLFWYCFLKENFFVYSEIKGSLMKTIL